MDEWLGKLNLEKYASVFADVEIDLLALPLLTEDDLRELGLPLGPRRKILDAASRISADTGHIPQSAAMQSPVAGTTGLHYARLTGSANEPTAERRHLTVMFVDLVNSTGLSTTLDAEDMRKLIRLYQGTVTEIIDHYHGFVARYVGDGVLCYFGWPQANEDDAENCIRAGLSVIEAVKQIIAPNNQPLATRLGVASGVVVIGDLIGCGASEQAAAVGETPNLAARLQQLAQHNELIVGHSTRELLGSLFDLKFLGEQNLKGIPHPVGAFCVIGESLPQSRFESRQSGALPPIIGRNNELHWMQDIWQHVRQSRGQVVFITGEAGIGKSRTLRAIVDQIDAVNSTHFQCSPYYSDTALYPVVSQLTNAVDILAADTEVARYEKLATLPGVSPDNLHLLAALLDIEVPDASVFTDDSPAAQRRHTLEALCQLYTAPATEKPLLLVFEDIHWIDPTTLELIGMLASVVAEKKALLLATSREQPEAEFDALPYIRTIRLERLETDSIRSIIERLTGGKPVSDDVLNIIEARTDGIPLYVEELTKTLLESGQLCDSGSYYSFEGLKLGYLAIPNSLHDSLMARLDRMQSIKLVAQMAACIGREFGYQLLLTVSALPEPSLRSTLDRLIGAELIVTVGDYPSATYHYKHALLRDAAYNSLLKEKRQTIHGTILQHLESLPGTEPELLAHHATNAGDEEAATRYWERAGEQALARPAFKEAISHFDKALELVPSLSTGDDKINRELDLRAKISYASMAFYGFGHSIAAAANSSARALLDQVKNSPHRVPVLYGSWTIHNARAEYTQALHVAELLVQDALTADRVQQLNAYRMRAVSLTMRGDFGSSDTDFEAAQALYNPDTDRKLAIQYGLDPGISIRVYHATSLLCRGEAQRAFKLMHNIAEDARASENPPTYSAALFQLAMLNTIRRDTECETWIEKFLQVSVEQSLVFWQALAHAVSGVHLYAQERYSQALSETETALGMLDNMGVVSNTALFSAVHAASLAALGRFQDAEIAEQRALGLITPEHGDWAAAEVYRIVCESRYRHLKQKDSAIEGLELSIDLADKQGARLWQLRSGYSLASILVDSGNLQEAHGILTAGLIAMPNGGAHLRDVRDAKLMLATLTS